MTQFPVLLKWLKIFCTYFFITCAPSTAMQAIFPIFSPYNSNLELGPLQTPVRLSGELRKFGELRKRGELQNYDVIN